VYSLEGFYVLHTAKSAKSHEIARTFEPKWVITLLIKGKYPKYLGKYVFTFAFRFYVNPILKASVLAAGSRVACRLLGVRVKLSSHLYDVTVLVEKIGGHWTVSM